MKDRLSKVEEKLDKLIEKTGGIEEQFKALNGSVRDLKKKDIIHDDSFNKVYEKLKIEAIERERLKGNIKLYIGIAIGVSAGISLITAIIPLL